MTLWMQGVLVLLIVLLAAGWAGWQGYRSLLGKHSKIGSCCARGCQPPQEKAEKPGQRIAIIPVEMLGGVK